MKNKFLVIITLVTFLIQSCDSTSKLTIKTIDERTQIISPKAIEYETFREAMENIDLSYLREHQVNSEQQSFAEALKLIIEGKLVNAEILYRELNISSNDSLIKKDSEKILNGLLFFQSKWEALLELDSNSIYATETENNNQILVEAFNKSPKESYFFPSGTTTLQIELSRGGNPIIEVEINGQKKIFWIDTGAGMSVVASDIATECNVFPVLTGKGKAGTATSKQVDIQPAIIKDLKIGEISIKNHPVIIINKKDLEFKLFGLFRLMKIDGIIGWNAIQNLDIEIDYRSKVSIIKKPVKIDNQNRNFFWLGYPIVKLKNKEGRELNFGLDTGAKKTSVRDNILKKISNNIVTIKSKTLSGAGGIEKIESKNISDLTLILNNYAIHFIDIGTNPSDVAVFVKLDGILGSDIFKNGKIKIDYLNGIFEFENYKKN